MIARLVSALFFAVAIGPISVHALDYEADVLPIFEAKCFKCHGDGKSKAGVSLDLDKIGREIGDVITAGSPEQSDLYASISTDDNDDLMPPPGKGPALSEREIKLVHDWIAAGAPIGGESTTTTAGGDDKEESSLMASRPEPLKTELTNKEGKTIAATLLRVEDDKAVLQLANGKTYHYPIGDLEPASQEIVRDFALKSGG